jgi:hypothetical protein
MAILLKINRINNIFLALPPFVLEEIKADSKIGFTAD